MKTLPKYFIILRDATNPLWDKYIQWLNKTYNENWQGTVQAYYGYNGICTAGYTVAIISNNPTIITLDYWNECVNGFQLPKKWCIRVSTDKINDAINSIRLWSGEELHFENNSAYTNHYIGYDGKYNRDLIGGGYTEITFEQFTKYVLKQDTMKEYKFTPEYCKTHKVAIHVDTTEEVRLCDELLKNNEAHKYLYRTLAYTGGNQGVCCKNDEHGSVEWYKDHSYEIIKAKDFINFNSKNMEKKLIGYKLVKPEMYKAASQIMFGNSIGCPQLDNILYISETGYQINELKSAGVLDLWFEPVYANSTPDITIKGYKAEFTKTSVKFGCQTYTKEFVLTLAKCLEDNDFDMDIKDEILEIAKYFKSL